MKMIELLAAFVDANGHGRFPAKEEPFDPEDGGVPPAMWDGDPDGDGIVRWKSVPSGIDDAQLDALEEEYGVRFPSALRQYLTYAAILNVEKFLLPNVPSDNPLGPLTAGMDAWKPLIAAGFLPYGEYGDGYGPVCFDSQREDGDAGRIVWFDHEELIALGEDLASDRDRLLPIAKPLFSSFEDHLQHAVDRTIY